MTNSVLLPYYVERGGSWFNVRASSQSHNYNFNTRFFRYEGLSVRLMRRAP